MDIFAHRGADHLSCGENTMRAFSRAVDLGCDGVELDVHATKDGHLVVCHDSEIPAFGGKIKIQDFTLDVFVASKLVIDGIDGKKPPTLRLVLENFAPITKVNIELKDPGSAIALINLFNTHKTWVWQSKIIVSSFLLGELKVFKKSFPEIETCLALKKFKADCENCQDVLEKDVAQSKLNGLHIFEDSMTIEAVGSIKRHNLKTRVGLIDDSALMFECFRLGVDGIVTNKAQELVSALRASPHNHYE